MIVDDNQLNQVILQKMLEKMPMIVDNKISLIVADNGEEAYQQFIKLKNVKLILTDCEMPILDGYEASKKIRDAENLFLDN